MSWRDWPTWWAPARPPTDAHRRAAGTSVVTDLLVLRRRDHDRSGNGELWERVAPLEVPPAPRLDGSASGEAGLVEMNQWFHDHPELVLGRMRLGRSAHRDNDLLKLPARPVEATALEQITSNASMAGLTASPTTSADLSSPVQAVEREGLIEATEDGAFTRIADGVRSCGCREPCHASDQGLRDPPPPPITTSAPASRPHSPTLRCNRPMLRRDRLGGLVHEYVQVARRDRVLGTHQVSQSTSDRPSVRLA